MVTQRSNELKWKLEISTSIANLVDVLKHDLRSPLTSVRAALDVYGESSMGGKFIRDAVDHIGKIIGDLELIYERESKKQSFTTEIASDLLRSEISRKSLEYSFSRPKLSIKSFISEEAKRLFVRVNPTKFRRAISNLVNNSVEAIDSNRFDGRIEVNLKYEKGFVLASVKDNGKGIEGNILKNIFKRGFTDKEKGCGLGLFQVKTDIESFGGKVKVYSEEAIGTTVTLSIPECRPNWICRNLNLADSDTVVVVDDDKSVHSLFQEQARRSGKSLDFQFATNEHELKNFLSNQNSPGLKFCFDYDLKGKEDGLMLISKFGLEDRSILVTNNFNNESVHTRASNMGVPVLPKIFLQEEHCVFES